MSFEQRVVQLEETNANLVKEVVRVRDAAMGLSQVYTTTSAGVAAVADGEYFTVPGSGAFMKLYRRNGGAADLIAEYPDRQRMLDAVSDAEAAAANAENSASSTFDILIKDVERAQFEAATGGQCTIERTPNGQASYMYVSARQAWEDLLPGQELGTGTHEAFLENGVEKSELLTGMFMASEVNGELVSQPRTAGRRSIDWDQAVSMANAAGFSLMSNWEWSFLALWCMANGWQPRGNTDYGVSHSHPHECGVYDGDGNGEEYTLLGSGPNTWNHNNAANGIADLVGNRWEWVWGFKMVDGRIFLAPDNDRSVAESSWVDTGWDMPGGGTWASQDSTGAPQSVKRALIMPNGVADPDGNLWTNLEGERFPYRGGARNYAGSAGLGALYLHHPRSSSNTAFGLRLSRLV